MITTNCNHLKQFYQQDAGVDVIVAEGFEAGGHNGRDETTTLTLIPVLTSSKAFFIYL